MNNRDDVFIDIFLLSKLIMKREVATRQRFESGVDVNCWSTGNANTEIREVEVNKILNKPEDMSSRSWNSRCVGAFVHGVQDDVSRELTGPEHVFEALHQCMFIGLLLASLKG